MRYLLHYLAYFLTRQPRQVVRAGVDFEWSNKSWTHNVFRVFELVFGRRAGIRCEAWSWKDSKGKEYHVAYTFEATCALIETAVRKWFAERQTFRISVPTVELAGGVRFPASPYLFAIATDAFSGIANSASVSHTCTGSNLVLVSFVTGDVADNLTGYTYAGTNMVQAGKKQETADRWFYSYVLATPATGANNITDTGLTYRSKGGLSYSGCSQTGQPDSHNELNNQGPSTTFTATTTVVASNCWIVGFDYGGSANADGTGVRRGSTIDGLQNGDSNGTVGTGVQSFTLGQPSNVYGMLAVSIKPVATATIPSQASDIIFFN